MRQQRKLFLLGLSLALGITTTWAALAQQPELGTFATIDFPAAVSTGGARLLSGLTLAVTSWDTIGLAECSMVFC